VSEILADVGTEEVRREQLAQAVGKRYGNYLIAAWCPAGRCGSAG